MKKTLVLLLGLSLALMNAGCTKREIQYAKEPDISIPEKGSWTDDIYRNDFANITFQKGGDWIKATEEELSKLQAPEGVYYDFVCQHEKSGSQITVMTEELLLTEGTITITEEEYIEKLSEAFASSGMEIIATEDIRLGEEVYKSVTVYGESENFKVTQCSAVRKKGSVMISVIFTAFNDDEISDMLGFFTGG